MDETPDAANPPPDPAEAEANKGEKEGDDKEPTPQTEEPPPKEGSPDAPGASTPKQPPQSQDTKGPGPKEQKAAEPGQCLSPTPSGEELPPEESNKIISLTLEILQLSQKKVDDQKISSHSLSFMLLRIKESLEAFFKDYIPTINTFLYHADSITAQYYQQIVCELPHYGDYVKTIDKTQEDAIEIGLPAPIPKEDLHEMVNHITNNYHAAAMFTKAGRANYKDIYCSMNERKDMVIKVVKNIPDWLKLQDNVTRCLEDIREQTFKISAYVDFLKQGESKIAPSLDLSKLNRKEDPESGNTRKTSIIKAPKE